MNENYPVFTKWMLILELIMDRAEGIPKSVRYSLTSRILNYANDILELVIEAIYSQEKAEKIDRMNLILGNFEFILEYVKSGIIFHISNTIGFQ